MSSREFPRPPQPKGKLTYTAKEILETDWSAYAEYSEVEFYELIGREFGVRKDRPSAWYPRPHHKEITYQKYLILKRQYIEHGHRDVPDFVIIAHLVDEAFMGRDATIDAFKPPQALEPQKITNPGCVYLLRCERFYKIGASKDVDKRIHALSASSPFRLELIWIIESEDMYRLESLFHERFAHKRHRGEWFALDQDDIESFKTHTKCVCWEDIA